jgi:hypothetical protein
LAPLYVGAKEARPSFFSAVAWNFLRDAIVYVTAATASHCFGGGPGRVPSPGQQAAAETLRQRHVKSFVFMNLWPALATCAKRAGPNTVKAMPQAWRPMFIRSIYHHNLKGEHDEPARIRHHPQFP